MRERGIAAVVLAGALVACAHKEESSPCVVPERTASVAVALFDGKSLAGWDGDPAVWQVVDGQIVGNSGRRQVGDNTFLILTNRTFSNFVLSADVLLVDDVGNSGIQFRSTIQDPAQWIVTGYQADVGHGLWGLLYEEALGRGALMNPSQACSAAAVVGGWNHYEIVANGCRIVVKLNGALCSTFGEGDASRPRDGYIALQYHAPGGFEVRFRNILLANLL